MISFTLAIAAGVRVSGAFFAGVVVVVDIGSFSLLVVGQLYQEPLAGHMRW
jgi:hypothetical protein